MIGSGDNKVDFTYIGNVVHALILTMHQLSDPDVPLEDDLPLLLSSLLVLASVVKPILSQTVNPDHSGHSSIRFSARLGVSARRRRSRFPLRISLRL